ncbi:MAG: F0F1 ATP synthase subunit delta [Verrucomicrobiae bacterium]|nr:F0F1 ATP synthase subunit delta [Verrucomicrobiae bacterium]MCB1447470.1 F0F1 ATP synthase subunit delta [Rhizobiaceae bacterium]MCP5532986.1 F0F1 ATP synthase subunit delta [Akkermansiaceae bacterium]MCP5543583.1 F0F1 ATP synthase subunit delta [Akkermansiaceae bacterium]
MKISKVAASNARRLFGLCMVGGRLDESRMRTVVSKLVEEKPRDYRAILVAIQRLARLDADRRNVVIESAVPLDEASRQRVVAGLAKDYGTGLNVEYKVEPKLLGGLRIRVGNDVLDGSVQGRLDRLARAF